MITEHTGHVFKGERHAATLRRLDGAVEFTYTERYLANPGPAVATTLPLSERPVMTPAGAIPPFFANLLPEGRRLTALRRAVKASADDELSLLLAVGEDPVGDVRVLAHQAGADVPSVPPIAVESAWDEIDFRDVLAASALDPSPLAGVQDKVSGRLITVPLIHEGRAHLLKISPPEYPRLVENEAFFLAAAQLLRQPVVSSQIVHDTRGTAGLLIRRFDRVVTSTGTLRRLPVEDGAQLLGIYPADKYNVTFEQLALRFSETCSSRPLALRAAITQLALAWLTGNGELHAKNISVVGADRVWTPAPIYDIPSTVPYGDSSLALSVAGRTTGLSRRRLLALAETLGLPQAATDRAIDETIRAVDAVRGELDTIGFDPRRERDLKRVLAQRRRTLSRAEGGSEADEGSENALPSHGGKAAH